MKSFRFPLEAVLTLREEREQTAQRNVARALAVVAAIQTSLGSLERELHGLGSELQRRLARGVPACELGQLGSYQVVLTERRTRLQQDLRVADEAVQQARAELVRATQDRQALENYRTRLRRAHDANQARAEQKLLDDLAGRTPPFGTCRRISSAFAVP